MTEVIVEQPRLHRVCKKARDIEHFPSDLYDKPYYTLLVTTVTQDHLASDPW